VLSRRWAKRGDESDGSCGFGFEARDFIISDRTRKRKTRRNGPTPHRRSNGGRGAWVLISDETHTPRPQSPSQVRLTDAIQTRGTVRKAEISELHRRVDAHACRARKRRAAHGTVNGNGTARKRPRIVAGDATSFEAMVFACWAVSSWMLAPPGIHERQLNPLSKHRSRCSPRVTPEGIGFPTRTRA
jgi:hypothetical protein